MRITLKSGILFLGLFCFQFSKAEFKIIGYLYNWGNFVNEANALDYTKLTHVNISFVNPNNSGDMSPTNSLSTVVNIIHNGNAKAIASVGGANSATTWSTLMQTANRSAFIHKIKLFLYQYNLDGIDMDLEGAAIDNNYSDFVIELSDSLAVTGKTLTAAVATWNGNDISDAALARFDFINIMSYDEYGTWTNAGQHSSYSKAIYDLNYWGNIRGIAKEKLILGLPSYGYRWETNSKTSLSYKNIVNLYPGSENHDHITTTTNGDIYYNGIPTIKQKTSLALSDAGGIMWWAMQFDFPTNDNKSLLKAAFDVIQASSNNKKPTAILLHPAHNETFYEGDSIVIEANANDTNGVISFVSFYADNLKIGQDTGVNFKFTWKTAGPGTYKIFAMAVDDAFASTYSDTITITVNDALTQAPFGGISHAIPGKIEAENFDIGSNLGYYDLSTGNDGDAYRTGNVDIENCSDVGGGYSVGWIEQDEWLEYTVNVSKDSIYEVKARVATTGNNKSFYIEIDGQKLSTFAIANTGGWQTWKNTIAYDVPLTAGEHVLRLFFETGEFNLNYLYFNYSDPNNNIGVAENKHNQIVVFPNPAQNEFYINCEQNSLIKIYDSSGRLMMQENAIGNHRMDISSLNSGIYTLQINNSEFVKWIKN
ncbi:MAG: glycosyl hydrolase family 18 protein [Flavobacteriales bacterium]